MKGNVGAQGVAVAGGHAAAVAGGAGETVQMVGYGYVDEGLSGVIDQVRFILAARTAW